MRLLPMDVPAEIHRWVDSSDSGRPERCDVTVARGPLVLMARGLMAIQSEMRGSFWITSEAGDLTPLEAEEALREWARAH